MGGRVPNLSHSQSHQREREVDLTFAAVFFLMGAVLAVHLFGWL